MMRTRREARGQSQLRAAWGSQVKSGRPGNIGKRLARAKCGEARLDSTRLRCRVTPLETHRLCGAHATSSSMPSEKKAHDIEYSLLKAPTLLTRLQCHPSDTISDQSDDCLHERPFKGR